MRVLGTLHEADDDVKSKVRKGAVFPADAQVADLFTLIDQGKEILYIKKSDGWHRLILDGDNIDAGDY